MTQLAVVDTHALVWWAKGEHRRLGKRARRMFERVDAGEAALYVPVLVLEELGELAVRGIVALSGGLDGWARVAFSSGRLFPADLTVGVVLRAALLRSIPERTDRLIAATAAELGHPLVTRDPAMAAAGVQVLW